jgi:hypothetical protein
MNRYLYLFILLMLGCFADVSQASEPTTDSTKVKVGFVYDLDFDMQFDNREFDGTSYTSSMTVFGARVTPAVGIGLQQKNGTKHRLMVGIDIMKDFGSARKNSELFDEITLYYDVQKQIGKTGFEMVAGVFPRRYAEGSYSQAFYSDSLRFYDNNLEGLLLKFSRPKAYFEIGCDWMGMYDTYSRERFQIFSSGEGRVLPFLSLGYAASLYHFSFSGVSVGVVDNALVNPYLRFDMASMTDMQTLAVRLGWLQALQNDRANVGHYVFPGGAEVVMEVQKWNVGLRNDMFIGTDIMPYYNTVDNAGYKYGNVLYMGSPFYRVWDDGRDGIGLADRLEVYYAPKFGAPYLDMKVSAIFHFDGEKYCGCRQMVSLNFNLEKLLCRKK